MRRLRLKLCVLAALLVSFPTILLPLPHVASTTAWAARPSGLVRWAGVAAAIPWHAGSSTLLAVLAAAHAARRLWRPRRASRRRRDPGADRQSRGPARQIGACSTVKIGACSTMGRVLRTGMILLIVLVGLLTVVWLLQRRLIYFPDTAAPPAGSGLPGAQEITLRTEDGLALSAWHVTPTGADRGVTVLVMPGNAGSRALRAPLARRLAAKGLGVLLLDYRGYGGNPGNPSEEGLISDARAARAYLVGHGVPADRLIYFGESLGAAVATRLAIEQPPGALVLRSPFIDLAAVGSRHYPLLPVRLLLWDRFPVTKLIDQVQVPTAVVYGSADMIVPPEQSAAVAAAAGDPVRVIEVVGADHNDAALLEGNELVAAVVDLARSLS
jgi:uncharacterized protein